MAEEVGLRLGKVAEEVGLRPGKRAVRYPWEAAARWLRGRVAKGPSWVAAR